MPQTSAPTSWKSCQCKKSLPEAVYCGVGAVAKDGVVELVRGGGLVRLICPSVLAASVDPADPGSFLGQKLSGNSLFAQATMNMIWQSHLQSERYFF